MVFHFISQTNNMHSSTNLCKYLSFFFALCCLNFIGNATTFQTPNATSLKFLGNAHMFNNSVRLTDDLLVPNSDSGRFLFNKPVRFRSLGNPNPVSFKTSFSFSIANLNPNSIGGGLAFVISTNKEEIGQAGGYLGILSDDIALEFDTCKDIEFKDINGNHIGLNIGSMISKQVANLDLVNVSLRSGKIVNLWLEYSGSTKQLNVFITYDETKPNSPVLSRTIDLYEYVNDFMYVGFSGSTQGSTEIHSIGSWSFTSFFDDEPADTENPGPNSPPPTSSRLPVPLTSSTTPTGPTTQKHTKAIYGSIIGAVVIIIVALISIWNKDSIRPMFAGIACCCSTSNGNTVQGRNEIEI